MSTCKEGRDKFQAEAVPYGFLGYPYGKKTYRAMTLDTQRFHTSSDIVFHENIFPFSIQTSKPLFPREDAHGDSECLSTHFDSADDQQDLHNPPTPHI